MLIPERTVSGLHASLVGRIPRTITKTSPILDLGFGSGAWLQRLSKHGFLDLTGIERDTRVIQSQVGTHVIADLDSREWSVPEKKFSLITAIEVIEHLGNIGLFLEQAKMVMTDDGWMLLTSPNIHSLSVRFRFLVTGDLKQFGNLGDTTHIFPIVLSTFPRLLRRYGLELVEYWGYPGDGRTITSRRLVNWGMRLFRLFLPEHVPGDVICMLIKQARAR